MKKLLAILGAVGLTATASVAVVSCSGDKANWKLNDDGKVILNTVKGVKTDLGEVADFSYKTIQNNFFELNSDILPEDSSAAHFFVRIDSDTTAIVTGANKQLLYGTTFDEGVKVTFTVAGSENLVDLSALTLDKELDEAQAANITWYTNSEGKTIPDYTTTTQAFFDANKDALPARTTASDLYINGKNFTEVDATTRKWEGTVNKSNTSKILKSTGANIKFSFIMPAQ